jgi:hypothetical protein
MRSLLQCMEQREAAESIRRNRRRDLLEGVVPVMNEVLRAANDMVAAGLIKNYRLGVHSPLR